MLLIAINVGLLLVLLSQKKAKKNPLIVALLFAGIKVAAIIAIGVFAATAMGEPAAIGLVLLSAGIRGVISFLSAWALLALLKRIDDIEIAERLAPKGTITKKRSVVLEWIGVLVAGGVCAIS